MAVAKAGPNKRRRPRRTKSHTVARCRFLRCRQLCRLVLGVGRRIVLSCGLRDNPARLGVPLTEDLEPGPHDAVAGLAWDLAHCSRASSPPDSATGRLQVQPRSKSSLLLSTPSFCLARFNV